MNISRIARAVALALAAASVPALAAPSSIAITEVDARGSSAAYGADWFELTNVGNAAVNITGWKMDDDSNSFAAAVALRGITSIAAGQSVIFIESNSSGSKDNDYKAAFLAAWFGAHVPANLAIGFYGGSGVGLSASADAVNIFDAAGNKVTGVSFGASPAAASFDNAAGASGAISLASAAGVNGAFLAANGAEIGSPGSIAAVPEPETYALMLAGLGLLGFASRRRG